MSIDTQALKSSELGKIVLFYTKCKRVELGIKRIADQLVSKSRSARAFIQRRVLRRTVSVTWMRPLLRRSANYRNRPAVLVSDPSLSRGGPSGPRVGTQSLSATGVSHARIPETVHQAYLVAPQSHSQVEGTSRVGMQKATAKKSREFAKRLAEARKGERRAT